jgi:hypothetical protein
MKKGLLKTADAIESAGFIESCIDRSMPLVLVLRLLILRSLTTGGIPAKEFDQIRRDIIQVSLNIEHSFLHSSFIDR